MLALSACGGGDSPTSPAPTTSGSTTPAPGATVLPVEPLSWNNPQTCTVVWRPTAESITCDGGRAFGGIYPLIGIKAPRLGQSPYGGRTAEAFDAMLPNNTVVQVEFGAPPLVGAPPVYVRLPDGTLLQERLAREGWVVDFYDGQNGKYRGRLASAVRDAKANRRGHWAAWGFACLPWDFDATRCR
jgi:hypothetical protein